MIQYIVTGMSCAACSARVEKAVSKVPGVTSCSVSLLTNSMGVEGTATEQEIIKAVKDAGYGASKKGEGAAKVQPAQALAGEDMLKDRETPVLKRRLIASVGFLIAFDWRLFVLCAIVFFVLFLGTHYVSLCSLSCYLVALIAMIVRGEMGGYGMGRSHTTEMYIVMGFLTVLAFWRHRANIVRLANGTENKIFLGKTKKG